MSNVLNYAHNLAMTDVKHDRMMGKLWSFPCTAGRKIWVISGSGSLSACELRDEVIDLRDFGFDVQAAMATGAMEREREQIAIDRCDCIHGCFIGSSLQHSPKAVVTEVAPRALEYFTRRRRTPSSPANIRSRPVPAEAPADAPAPVMLADPTVRAPR
jgi:hypothetical protein